MMQINPQSYPSPSALSFLHFPATPRRLVCCRRSTAGMDTLILFFFFTNFSSFLQLGRGQSPGPSHLLPPVQFPLPPSSSPPSIPVVIGILSVMFALTFLLLMYVKLCRVAAASDPTTSGGSRDSPAGPPARFSGIDKAVVESLPLFRFSSLKGSKQGLDCAVCLSHFADSEMLRLLPKCRHAFHLDCVGRWLEIHSSCPLCRRKVDPRDLAVSRRHLVGEFSNLGPAPAELAMGLFVEREADINGSSSFSFRKGGNSKSNNEEAPGLHRLKHTIVVSDAMARSRWSDVSSSDLMFLSSELLAVASSRRWASSSTTVSAAAASSFSASGQASTSSSSLVDSFVGGGKRCMSEMSGLSRSIGGKKGGVMAGASIVNGGKEERLRRKWSAIARRTVEWFSGGGGGRLRPSKLHDVDFNV